MSLLTSHHSSIEITDLATVNIMAFYAASLFTAAGAAKGPALFFSWGFGLVNFVYVIPEVTPLREHDVLYQTASPGRRFPPSIRLVVELSYSSRSPIWLGLCWPLHSASKYQPETPHIDQSSRFLSIFFQRSIHLARVRYLSPTLRKHFLCSIVV